MTTMGIDVQLGQRHIRLLAGGGTAPPAVGGVLDDACGENGDGVAEATRAGLAGTGAREGNGGREPAGGEGRDGPGAGRPGQAYGIRDEPEDPRQAAHGRRMARRNKRAYLAMATLNMRGKNMLLDGVQRSKWVDVHNMMKVRRLGVLGLQETHLDDDDMEMIGNLYGRRLEVIASRDPDRPTQSAGVAFVLNKDVIEVSNVVVTEIVPGRALLIDITWREGQRVSILNVYAPNAKRDQVAFFDTVRRACTARRRKPDFMMGDFNLVEDAIDRSPARMDDADATTALREARQAAGLVDTWRHTFATARRFTYQSHRQNMSRLDRIYARPSHERNLFEWEIGESPVQTDHRMVTVRFAPEDSPEVGAGRWTWPRALYNNEILKRTLAKRAALFANEVREWIRDGGTNRERNPQTMLRDAKEDFRLAAKKVAGIDVNKIHQKIRSLERSIGITENNPEIDESVEIREEVAQMRQEHEHLLRKARKDQADTGKVNWEKMGETVTPYWIAINAVKKPRDLFTRLRVPGSQPPRYVTASKDMATAMRDHLDGVQRPPEDAQYTDAERVKKVETVLGLVPEGQRLTDEESAEVGELLSGADVRDALVSMPSGRATGLDGIPYEVWRLLLNLGQLGTEAGDTEVKDIADLLACVYRDIQLHGVDANTEFHVGWVCPLFKKGECTETGNYRPITLLNSDYKVMTKALTMRLAKVIVRAIHPDQAGFVPGRLIFDHVRLSRAMISYAEAYEKNGLIVALDQEKAYDRITHEYLWQTLQAFNVPEAFIKTVRSLYTGATSVVMVNGERSGSFRITRGVRQGDPLSCLLFDLAIEPLGCMLRSNKHLRGFDIPGRRDRLVVNLFADDTLVYMGQKDKMTDLLSTLDLWCAASGAKFNEGKTEVVPIGTAEYRRTVLTTRRIAEGQDSVPCTMRIAQDGHTIRSLGARIGNNGDELQPWSTILDKIEADLDRWNKGHPTLDGKKHIVQMVVGGKTQYLTRVQGMPKDVENRIKRLIRGFMWPGKRVPPIALERLYRPIEEGGIGLLDIKARNLAIEGTWIRDYLNLTKTRPTWALITDEMLKRAVPEVLEYAASGVAMLHKWSIPTKGKRFDTLPSEIRSMLKAMTKLDVQFAAVKLSDDLKKQMPAWGHLGAARWTYNQGRDECLATRHAVETIGELLDVSMRPRRTINGSRHSAWANCVCEECEVDRLAGCEDPDRCVRRATQILAGVKGHFSTRETPPNDNLTLTHHRLEKNATAIREHRGERVFNPSVTTKGSLAEGFRILVDKSRLSAQPAHRLVAPLRGLSVDSRHRVIYTDGSCTGNGESTARSGAGVWHAAGSRRNRAIRVPGDEQSNQIGEIVAAIVALQGTPPEVPVTIRTDSLYVMDGMTKHLDAWEDKGWIGITNKAHLQSLAYQLRKRTAPTFFEKVKAHSGDPGNDGADALAKEGADKVVADDVDLRVAGPFDLQGAKLAGIRQSTIYKGLRERARRDERRRTTRNTALAEEALRDDLLVSKPESAIWAGTRNKDLRKGVRQFFFQALHGAQKTGASHWANAPGYEDRARCTACGHADESMAHILLECPESTERRTVWAMVAKFWPVNGPRIPRITMGLLLACGALQLKPEDGDLEGLTARKREARGTSRLLRVTLSEAAHLIWALRCERVIQGKAHSTGEVERRWTNKMNTRLTLDRVSAIKVQRTKWSRRRLRDMWHRVVQYEGEGDPGRGGAWDTDLRVLVGIRHLSSRPTPGEGR
jgi:ribonuclease HI/exonuclease III